MRTFILLALLLCSTLLVWAQPAPTFTSQEFPTGKTALVYPTAALSAGILPAMVPQGGTNVAWDYTALPLGSATPGTLAFAPSTGTAATIGGFQRGPFFEELAQGYGYYNYEVYTKDANAFAIKGLYVAEQRYGLLGLPGASATDSLIFAEQAVAYSAPLQLLSFPMESSTVMHSSVVYQVSAQLTLAAFGLSNATVSKRTHETRTDSVIGWGTLQMPTASGPSAPHFVLLVERHVSVVDSILLNGAPAPGMFMSAMGLTQGATSGYYRRSFWAAGRLQPLALVSSSNAAFTQNLSLTAVANVESGDAYLWSDFPDFDGSAAVQIPLMSSGDSSVFALPASGNGNTYDFGGVKNAVDQSYTLVPAAGLLPDFEGETYLDTAHWEALTPASGYFYNKVLRLSSHGLLEIGRQIEAQRYGVPSGPTDSLIIPAQAVVYETPLYQMRFPLTTSAVYTSSYSHEATGLLTISAFGINSTPISKREYATATDEVMGTGQIILPTANGAPSVPVDVILVQHSEHYTDSIFLGGMPAPALLLSAFGVQQGAEWVHSAYYFWSPGFLAPTLAAHFATEIPGATIENAVYRSDLTVGTDGPAGNFVAIFPNPASSSLRLIGSASAGQTWHLTDLAGREVLNGILATGMQEIAVEAPTRGLYLLTIRNTDGSTWGSAKVQLQ